MAAKGLADRRRVDACVPLHLTASLPVASASLSVQLFFFPSHQSVCLQIFFAVRSQIPPPDIIVRDSRAQLAGYGVVRQLVAVV